MKKNKQMMNINQNESQKHTFYEFIKNGFQRGIIMENKSGKPIEMEKIILRDYFIDCYHKNRNVPYPLFSLIKDQTLYMNGITMNKSEIEVLKNSFINYRNHYSMSITKIDINGCFLKDEGFAKILEGLNETEIIISITY